MKKTIYTLFSISFLLLFLSSCSKKGCTDPYSLAYDSEAKKDNGTCTYPENTKRGLVFKATATWCPPCGDWGHQYANDVYTDFPGSAEVIAIHSDNDFGVDIGYSLLGELDPQGYPAFFVGTEDMGYTGYSTISNALTSEINETNQVSLVASHSISEGKMTIKVQSQLEGSFSDEGECYLAVYILEDGQVATQQVGSPGAGVPDENFIHNHTLRAEASSLPFGQLMAFEGGKNLTEFEVTLAPSSIWVHENCYPLAVIWKKNGSDYDFINQTK